MGIVETINTIRETADAIALAIPSVIGVAAVIAAYFPKPEKPGLLASLHRYINLVGFNTKHAKNQE